LVNLVRIGIWTKHPGNFLDELIDWPIDNPTHCDRKDAAEHAAFIRQNGMVHELYYPRLRDRQIVEAERPYLKILEIEGLTPELSERLERWFDHNLRLNITYSIEDLFRVALDTPMPSEKSGYCSRYVIHGCFIILPTELWPLVRCTDDFISPRDLLISARLHEAEGNGTEGTSRTDATDSADGASTMTAGAAVLPVQTGGRMMP
jgi:hypothetical protein